MKYTKPALPLMKKYAAKCKIDWNNLGGTIFQPRLEARAKQLGSEKITIGIVRWYWLKNHNLVLLKLLSANKISEKDANYCMTSIKNGKVFHKGMFVEKIRGA